MLKEIELVMARTISDRTYEAISGRGTESEDFYENVVFGMCEMVLNILCYQGYSLDEAGEKLTEICQAADNMALKRKRDSLARFAEGRWEN